MLTLPETKMGSRVAAGLCHAGVSCATLPLLLHGDVAAVESPHLIARNEEDYLQVRSSPTFTAAHAVSDGSRSLWSLLAAGPTSCAE
jgi:hypothetical protein